MTTIPYSLSIRAPTERVLLFFCSKIKNNNNKTRSNVLVLLIVF